MIRVLLLVLPLTALAVEPGALVAPEAGTSTLEQAREVARFAAHLAGQNDHYRAIGEYKRALWLAGDAPEAARWALAIGESYRAGEQFEAAARQFEAVAGRTPAVRGEALLGAAKSWQSAGRYESSIERAREAAAAFGEGTGDARTAHYVEGWSLLYTGRDTEAVEAFRKARGDGRIGEGAEKLLSGIEQLDALPSRNPTLAGVLGLVPGFGHFYLGEPAIGVSALVWNGLFGWALIDAILSKNYSLAVVLGLFEAMWYGGSITGAISGAHRFNRDARVNAMEDLASGFAAPGLVDEIRPIAR